MPPSSITLIKLSKKWYKLKPFNRGYRYNVVFQRYTSPLKLHNEARKVLARNTKQLTFVFFYSRLSFNYFYRRDRRGIGASKKSTCVQHSRRNFFGSHSTVFAREIDEFPLLSSGSSSSLTQSTIDAEQEPINRSFASRAGRNDAYNPVDAYRVIHKSQSILQRSNLRTETNKIYPINVYPKFLAFRDILRTVGKRENDI